MLEQYHGTCNTSEKPDRIYQHSYLHHTPVSVAVTEKVQPVTLYTVSHGSFGCEAVNSLPDQLTTYQSGFSLREGHISL